LDPVPRLVTESEETQFSNPLVLFFKDMDYECRPGGFIPVPVRADSPVLDDYFLDKVRILVSDNVLTEDVADMVHKFILRPEKILDLAGLLSISSDSIMKRTVLRVGESLNLKTIPGLSGVLDSTARVLFAICSAAVALESMQIVEASRNELLLDTFVAVVCRDPSSIMTFMLVSMMVKFASRKLSEERLLRIVSKLIDTKKNPAEKYLAALAIYSAYHLPGYRRELDSLPLNPMVMRKIVPVLRERIDKETLPNTHSVDMVLLFGMAYTKPLYVQDEDSRTAWLKIREVATSCLRPPGTIPAPSSTP
jgi:hypothetical protein